MRKVSKDWRSMSATATVVLEPEVKVVVVCPTLTLTCG
jgi:hypothetical protein